VTRVDRGKLTSKLLLLAVAQFLGDALGTTRRLRGGKDRSYTKKGPGRMPYRRNA
jgi:hypothetical protein